jgi:hypothetical protein
VKAAITLIFATDTQRSLLQVCRDNQISAGAALLSHFYETIL